MIGLRFCPWNINTAFPAQRENRNPVRFGNSKSSKSKIMVAEYRAAMDKFKMEDAKVGVTLQKGYNGSLTSRKAGSIGG